MHRFVLAAVLAVAGPQITGAATYTVQNLHRGGDGSLRWAIRRANAHAGPDRIIFATGLAGGTIRPTTALDTVFGAGTTIDGDINNDGKPDIALDGSVQSVGAGLLIGADNCLIEGLALTRFPYAGIQLTFANNCTVRNCHLGVNLSGALARVNGYADLVLDNADSNVIGQAGKGNVISGGTGSYGGSRGIYCMDSQSNTIQNNTFGLKAAPNNNERLRTDAVGIDLRQSSRATAHNVVRNNVFAGLYYGVFVVDADHNRIRGNYFGLGVDGNTSRPMVGDCVRLMGGASGNRVGGTTSAARNVFVGGPTSYGIEIGAPGTDNNVVQGNYFGCNAAGTTRKPLRIGITIGNNAGPQLIGGTTAGAGNYFAENHKPDTTGVEVFLGGSGTTIQGNRFGVLPAGGSAPRSGAHLLVGGTTGVTIRDNRFTRGSLGVLVGYVAATSSAKLDGNTFRACGSAVALFHDSVARLGNLGNASTGDDGGNVFKSSNALFIRNETSHRIRAEGNSFDTTVKAEIEAKIIDRLDNPAYGRVDFIPLDGGVIPSGSTGAIAGLIVTGAAAVPTAAGAEVLFTLSQPADVTVEVMNIAGRRVAFLARDSATDAGLQRLVWNGRSLTGTAVPSGRYLARITARGAAGTQATALVAMGLGR